MQILLVFRTAFPLCDSNQTTPVDISPPIYKKPPIELNIYFSEVKKIKLTKEDDSTIIIESQGQLFGSVIQNDQEFLIRRIHLLMPSIHTIKGKRFALEMQVRAMNRLMQNITFGCFFVGKEGAEESPLESWGYGKFMRQMQVFNRSNIFSNPLYVQNGSFNLNDFFDFDSSFIEYEGETTFEPCKSSKWVILNKPLYLDQKLVEMFDSSPIKYKTRSSSVKFYQMNIQNMNLNNKPDYEGV